MPDALVDKQPMELTQGTRDVMAHAEINDDSSSIVLSNLHIVQRCRQFTNELHIAIIQSGKHE